MDFLKPLKLLIKENKSKEFILEKDVEEWFLIYNNFNIHPNYMSVFKKVVRVYTFKTKEKSQTRYYFNWDLILKDLKIKNKKVV